MSKLTKEIFINATVSELMAVAKAAEYSEARFAIDYNGILYACNSFRYCHYDMLPYSQMYEHGYVNYDDETKTFSYWTYKNRPHEIIEKFRKKEITNSRPMRGISPGWNSYS